MTDSDKYPECVSDTAVLKHLYSELRDKYAKAELEREVFLAI
jgi:hypothetical protein